jgi:hypothetical protein
MLLHIRFQVMWRAKAKADAEAEAWAESTHILQYLVVSDLIQFNDTHVLNFVHFAFLFECRGEIGQISLVSYSQYSIDK